MARKKLELHGYYFDGKKMYTMYIDKDGKIVMRKVLTYKYNAEIQDALYKIQCYSDHELVIPEHPDITAEVDKLLSVIAEAEDKMAVMELHYDGNVADKKVL